MTCTIFKNILTPNEPHYCTVDTALQRIKHGKSREKIEQIRATLDKGKAQELKKDLPSVCFSGKFKKRYDNELIEHSGFMVLDFDNVEPEVKGAELSIKPYCYALWVSPSGNGLKMLVRIADGKKHRDHFAALKEAMPEVDASGVNESRVCYESYDPNIFINPDAEVFTKTKVVEKIETREVLADEVSIFKNLLKWQVNKGGAFTSGQRNIFIFKLAGACCRYGIAEDSAAYHILSEYPTSSDFTQREAVTTIRSAYKSNSSKAGTACFDRGVLVDKVTRKEIKIDDKPKDHSNDIVYGISVRENAINIYKNGYERISGIGVPTFDKMFKAKRGELTGLTGIGNYGKSSLYKWFFLMRVLLFGEKFGVFPPEDFPPEEYYVDFVEILLGCDCTPNNPDRPKQIVYQNAYDFISNHIFCVAPKDGKPSPEYVLSCFLELIMKEKIDGVCTDPFNRLSHDYSIAARSDQYLEIVLSMFHRFGQQNNIYNWIVMHPNTMKKEPSGNYPCPDAYDLAGGAMWNNMLDNLLVYHRPFAQTEPRNPMAEFHTKKIKRQKSVGTRGVIEIEYTISRRRFEIDGHDCIGELLASMNMDFSSPVVNYKPKNILEPERSEQLKRFIANFQENTRLPYKED